MDITNRPECDILSLFPGEMNQTSMIYLRSLVQLQVEAVSQVEMREAGYFTGVWMEKSAIDLPINILGKYEYRKSGYLNFQI